MKKGLRLNSASLWHLCLYHVGRNDLMKKGLQPHGPTVTSNLLIRLVGMYDLMKKGLRQEIVTMNTNYNFFLLEGLT